MKQRLSIIICSITFLLLPFAVSAQQDEVLVACSGDDLPLNRALLGIRKDYQINIAYDSRALRQFRVTCPTTPMSLGELLTSWLEPFGFDWEYFGETIVVVPRKDQVGAVEPERFDIDVFGQVLDRASLEPLPFATICVDGLQNGVVSNEQGYFTINSVLNDTCLLVSKYIGYGSSEFRIDSSTKLDSVVIFMSRARAVLPVARVETYKEAAMLQSDKPSLMSLDVGLSYMLPNTGEPDIIRSIQLLPGVSGALENSSALHVRGGAGDENLVLYDGFTIYYLDHFYGLFSALNANSIQNVRLHKGVFSSRFGGRTSSVLEVTGKTGSLTETVVKTDLNLMSAAFHLESPILGERATMMVSARRSYTDVIFSPLYRQLFNGLYTNSITPGSNATIDAFANGEQPDFHFYDFTAKISLISQERDKISFSVYNGRDQLAIRYNERTLDQRFSIGYNDRSEWGNAGAGITWDKQWNARQHSSASIGASRFSSELFGFDSRRNLLIGVEDTLFFDRNTAVEDLSLRFDHQINAELLHWSLGLHATWLNVRNSNLNSEGAISRVQNNANVTAAYAEAKFPFRRRLNLTFGTRMVHYSPNNALYPEPRIRFQHEFIPGIQLHLAAGRNHQFIRNVRRQDLFLNTSDEWRLADDAKIPILRSDQFTLGFSTESDGWSFQTEAWYKWNKGAVEDALRFISLPENSFEDKLLRGEGNAIGVEAMLAHTRGIHSGWLTYTWSKTTNNFDELNREIPAWYDHRNEVKGVYMFRPGRFHANAVFVYASGKPYTPATGVYDIELVNNETEQLVAYSELHAVRLPAYHRLDLSFYYDLQVRATNATVGISLYNVYSRNNVRSRYYYLIGTSEEDLLIDLRDQLYLRFVPTIHLSIEW